MDIIQSFQMYITSILWSDVHLVKVVNVKFIANDIVLKSIDEDGGSNDHKHKIYEIGHQADKEKCRLLQIINTGKAYKNRHCRSIGKAVKIV